MSLLSMVLMLAVAAAAEVATSPTGRFCTEISVLVASEWVELWVNHEKSTFDFGATGLATIPWCPGNKYSFETDEDGNIIGEPIMGQATKCLLHELRHVNGEPPLVKWNRNEDTISVSLRGVPVLGELSFTLDRDTCSRRPIGKKETDDEL
eukprot:Sspe_Gene.74534::Locus_46364_Transcript_1_1_Confidence_1.000_Length_604::g.74534::m.74534